MTIPNPPGDFTVAPGQTIASDWGNAVWDQSIQRFASVADRDAQVPNPTDGRWCYTAAERIYWQCQGGWRAVSTDSQPHGGVLWGAPDAGPIKRIGGYWEGSPDGASVLQIDLPTGRPWTAIADVQGTSRFKYGQPNWVNVLATVNVESCVPIANGGRISYTLINPSSGAGIAGFLAGVAWSVTYQD